MDPAPNRARRRENEDEGLELTRFHDLPSVEAAWRRLEAAAGSGLYPFQRFDWAAAWMRTIGEAHGWAPLIILARRSSDGAEALLPMGWRSRRGQKVLGWLGEGVSDYAGPILPAAGGLSSAELVRAAARAGLTAGCDLLALSKVPALLANRRANPALGPGWRRLHYTAHGLDMPADLEAFMAERFSRKERYNLRRAEKKLAEEGGLAFAVPGDPEGRAAITEAMIRQKRERYAATGAVDPLADPATRRFYVEATEAPGLGVETSALLAGGDPVAAHWGVVHGDTAYFLMPTFDASREKQSPGKVFLVKYLERCAATGIRRLDLTIGDEDYKAKWQSDETALFELVRGLSVRGRVAAIILGLLHRAKAGPLLAVARRAKKMLRPAGRQASRRP